MPVPKQYVGFTFLPADQARAQRQLPVGQLARARNVWQSSKAGEYRKRHGTSRLSPTFSGGTWVNIVNAPGMVSGSTGALHTLDGDDQAWSYDPDANVWRLRGGVKRVMPTETVALTQQTAGTYPEQAFVVVAGTQLWEFAVDGAAGSGTPTKFMYTVFDASTGLLLKAQTSITTAGFVQLRAVYNGTDVWVFTVSGGTTIVSRKMSTTTFAVTGGPTTYQTVAGATLDNLDAICLTGAGAGNAVLVVAGGYAAPNYWYTHSLLDTATGAAKVAPAPVVVTAAAANADFVVSPSILAQDGASGSAWYTVWFPGAAGQSNLRLVQVTLFTLAGANTAIVTETGTNNTNAAGVSTGFVDDINSAIYLYSQWDQLSAAIRPDQLPIKVWLWDFISVTQLATVRGHWLASRPQKLATDDGDVSHWRLMLGYDDGNLGSAGLKTENIQRGYFLANYLCQIVSRTLWGQGTSLWHQFVPPSTTGAAIQYALWIPPLETSGTQLIGGVGIQAGSIKDTTAGFVRWETAASWGPVIAQEDRAVAPGGVVTTWGHATQWRELVPMLSPSFIAVSAGGTTYNVAALYRFVDADGTITPSAPIVGSLSINNGATVTIPSLRSLLTGSGMAAPTAAQVEFYAGAGTAGPFLQVVVPNDPTADTVTFTFSSTLQTDQTLYTVTSQISNEPAPPARHLAVFNDQLYLGGTDQDGDLWRSHEITPGFGVTFDSTQRLLWQQGTGEIRGLMPVDFGSLAIFKRDAIGVLRTGASVVQTLDYGKGLERADSLLTGPGGCYFVERANHLFVVTGDGRVVDVSGGIQDRLDTLGVRSAVHDTARRHLQFHGSTGEWLVLDYGFATPEQPAGQWYDWENTVNAMPALYGAAASTTGLVYRLEATGVLRYLNPTLFSDARSGATDAVLTLVSTSKLPVFGLQQVGRVSDVTVLGQAQGACTQRIVVSSQGVSSNHDLVIAGAGDWQATARPPALLRVQEVQLSVEETVNAGKTEGAFPEEVTLTVQPTGRVRFPAEAERL